MSLRGKIDPPKAARLHMQFARARFSGLVRSITIASQYFALFSSVSGTKPIF